MWRDSSGAESVNETKAMTTPGDKKALQKQKGKITTVHGTVAQLHRVHKVLLI